MLGMTPDTALVDLRAEETSRALASFLAGQARRWWENSTRWDSATVAVTERGTLDEGRVAMLTVVAHRVPAGAVPVEPAYVKDDGTRVTSPAVSEALRRGFGWERGRTSSGWRRRFGSGSEGWTQGTEPRGDSLYGAAPETFRMNYAVTAGEVARTFSSKRVVN